MSFIQWGSRSHPNFADGFNPGFCIPSTGRSYPECDAVFHNPWGHLLLANGGFFIIASAVVLAFASDARARLGDRYPIFPLSCLIAAELAVEVALHVVTGELGAVHAFVNPFKVVVILGYYIASGLYQKCNKGPRDAVFFFDRSIMFIGVPANFIETYFTYGDDGILALVILSVLFVGMIALLKQMESVGTKKAA